MVETTEEGYPVYLTKPINGTTRKAVLADLESKGWPLIVRATDLSMDSTTAARALYNVGYRWDSTEEPGKRNRDWHAPQEIVDLHTKAKAEAERREQEARAARQHLRLLPSQIVTTTDPAITAVRAVQRIHEASVINKEADHEPDMPEGRAEEAERLLNEAMRDRKLSSGEVPAGPGPTATSSGEREFVDDVDSWVVEGGYPREVYEYLDALRGAGLEVEIRVWRR